MRAEEQESPGNVDQVAGTISGEGVGVTVKGRGISRACNA